MTNWTDIHPDFTEELQSQWEELAFDKEEVHEWIEAGLKPEDSEFAVYFQDLEYTPEDVKNNGEWFLNEMRKQFNGKKEEVFFWI